MNSRSGLSHGQALALVALTVLVTAVTTHWVDRAGLLDVRRISPQEMSEMAGWLDDFYASNEGLQRPGGLCEGGRLDRGAVSAWLFDSYMQTRLRGTPDAAKAAIVQAIQESEEWQRKHRQ